MGVGVALGFPGPALLCTLAYRARCQRGAAPGVVAALAIVLYAVTSLAHGSGFLAVFVAGLSGDTDGAERTQTERSTPRSPASQRSSSSRRSG